MRMTHAELAWILKDKAGLELVKVGSKYVEFNAPTYKPNDPPTFLPMVPGYTEKIPVNGTYDDNWMKGTLKQFVMGDAKISMIKAIRVETGLGLKESKDLVEANSQLWKQYCTEHEHK